MSKSKSNARENSLEPEAYFDVIFKTLSEGVALNEIILNAEGIMIDYKVLAVNDAFYIIADFDRSKQVIGSLGTELYGLDLISIQKFWENHKNIKETIKTEYYSKLSDKYFIISTSPIINNRFVTSFFDITERKRTEEKIFEINENLKALITSMQDGFSIVDLNGISIDVNPALIRMTGFSREELLGIGAPHPYWPPEENELIQKAFIMTLQGEVETYELIFMRKNGERFPVVVTPYAVKSSKGLTISFAATIKDITERKRTEAALKESEIQYRLLFQNLNGNFALHEIILDKEGKPCDYRFLAANDAFEKKVGIKVADIIGKRALEIFPQTEKYWIDMFGKVALTGEPILYENYSKELDSHYELYTYSPKNGQFAIIGRDITQRKKVEEALIESETQYRSLFQNLNGVFALYETILDKNNKVCDLRYLAVNEVFEKAVGLKIIDVIGKTMLELFPISEPRWIELFGNVAETGIPVHYEDYSRQLDKHFEGYAFSPKKGQVAHIGRDITDRKKTEEELKESQNFLKFAMEGSGDGIWDWNIVEDKIFFSKRWHEIFGFEDQEITTTEAWKLRICPDDLPKVMKEVERHFETRIPVNQEHRFYCKDGSLKWVMVRGVVVTRNAEGQPLRMIGTTTDISRIKYAELQLIQASKLASLGEMSAGIAHEINNPLSIIIGMARSLAKSINNPEKFAEKVDAIQKSSMRISKIVGGLKKFSRSSEEKIYQKCRLKSIVNEGIALTLANAKRNEVSVLFESKNDVYINCDEVEIEQVLINLINNAIDAVKGFVEKWVKIEILIESSNVLLRITDSGKGIPLEIQSRLFDPFFTTKPVGEGTGLGLSIIKGILDEHEATIVIDAKSSNTCFEICFKKVELTYDS